jgi:hypothetical protein
MRSLAEMASTVPTPDVGEDEHLARDTAIRPDAQGGRTPDRPLCPKPTISGGRQEPRADPEQADAHCRRAARSRKTESSYQRYNVSESGPGTAAEKTQNSP